jgi:hypothetical protein
MQTIFATPLFAAAILLGVLICIELGRRLGLRRMSVAAAAGSAGVGTVDGAVFALLGLLLAFTFSSAAARFDQRRTLIVQEANAIGTAYLRLELVPAASQPPLRAMLRRYVQTRIAAARAGEPASAAELAQSQVLQGEIWRHAVAATRADAAAGASPAMLLLPALNDMFDLGTTRVAASRTHAPAAIFLVLFGVAAAAAVLAGYGMAELRRREVLHALAFAVVMTAALYLIVDLEYPRQGVIRVDTLDIFLADALAAMR